MSLNNVEKRETWILLSLKKCNSQKGLSFSKLFDKKPDFFSDDMADFLNLLEKLESKSYIKLSSKTLRNSYLITKIGRKNLKKNIKKMGDLEYIRFIKTIPEHEIKYRLRCIESTLGSFIIIVILFLMINILFKYWDNIYMIIILFAFMMFFFGILIGSSLNLMINFLYPFIKNFSEPLAEWIHDNSKIIATIVTILIIISILFVCFKIFGDKIIEGLIITLIITLIAKFRRIKNFFSLIISKWFNKKDG